MAAEGNAIDALSQFELVPVLGAVGRSVGFSQANAHMLLVVGLISKLVGGYVSTAAEHAIAFALLMAMLALRPQGLFGRPEVSKA